MPRYTAAQIREMINVLNGAEEEEKAEESHEHYHEPMKIGHREGVMYSQERLGLNPVDKVQELINEIKLHHPVDDSHILRKIEVKRMEDGTYSTFVEWMK